eukprot:3908182-Rhodomonas_salina.2
MEEGITPLQVATSLSCYECTTRCPVLMSRVGWQAADRMRKYKKLYMEKERKARVWSAVLPSCVMGGLLRRKGMGWETTWTSADLMCG